MIGRGGKGGGDARQHVRVGVEVVGVQKTDHIPACPRQALVQGLIEALVRFAHQGRQLGAMGLQHRQGAIGAGAIDDDMLAVGV